MKIKSKWLGHTGTKNKFTFEIEGAKHRHAAMVADLRTVELTLGTTVSSCARAIALTKLSAGKYQVVVDGQSGRDTTTEGTTTT